MQPAAEMSAQARPPGRRRLLWPALRTAALAVILAYAFRAFVAEPYSVPSPSMAPTILPGDHLVVDKTAFGYSQHSLPFAPAAIEFELGRRLPERGDIVVFADPLGTDAHFVKRVIGLPGDRIAGRRDGTLVLNGRDLARAASADGAMLERLPGGREIRLYDDGASARNEFAAKTVPDGHLFVVGDNRHYSGDSRVELARGGMGFVPAGHLVGRASHIVLAAATKDGDRFARFGAIE